MSDYEKGGSKTFLIVLVVLVILIGGYMYFSGGTEAPQEPTPAGEETASPVESGEETEGELPAVDGELTSEENLEFEVSDEIKLSGGRVEFSSNIGGMKTVEILASSTVEETANWYKENWDNWEVSESTVEGATMLFFEDETGSSVNVNISEDEGNTLAQISWED